VTQNAGADFSSVSVATVPLEALQVRQIFQDISGEIIAA
jgi:hypothetical protein